MRFATDDGAFGLIVTPFEDRSWHMYRFQLIVGGQVIGDTDECILGSAMAELTDLTQLDDSRLSGEPAAVLSLLRTDEALHDATVLSLAESLDRWLVCGYSSRGSTTVLAEDRAGRVLVSVVPDAGSADRGRGTQPVITNSGGSWRR